MTFAVARRLSRPFRGSGPRLLSWLAAGASVALLALPARATPEYPVVLDNFFDTDCPQLTRCLICHTSARGGQATAVQPFAQTLKMYGLNRGRDGQLLQNALMRLPDLTDSDEDGTPDKEELLVCGNPSGEDLGGGPEYGCDGARLAPKHAGEDVPLGLFALLAAAAIVQRRRGPAQR